MPAMKALIFGLALAALSANAFAADSPNTLMPAERAAGWKLLFDGKTLAGWKGFKTDAPDAGWKVENGALSPTPKISHDIITKENFENFDLMFDWKISPM